MNVRMWDGCAWGGRREIRRLARNAWSMPSSHCRLPSTIHKPGSFLVFASVTIDYSRRIGIAPTSIWQTRGVYVGFTTSTQPWHSRETMLTQIAILSEFAPLEAVFLGSPRLVAGRVGVKRRDRVEEAEATRELGNLESSLPCF